MSSRSGFVAVLARRLVKFPLRRASPKRALRRESSSLIALIAGVEAIGAPAFIVEKSGRVLHANANGRLLIECDPTAIAPLLARMLAGAPSDGGWELIPLSGRNGSQRFLAIRSVATRTASAVAFVHTASERWKLTRRQVQVLDLVARGMMNADIGRELQIGVTTVEFHVAAIFDKAGVSNRATLIARLHEL